MYLRSQQGQAQLDGLQVGAGVPHISPSTLLSSVLIPDPIPEEAVAVLQDYHRLCEMEATQQQLQKEIAELSAHSVTAEAR